MVVVERWTASTVTDDALDALYDRLERAELAAAASDSTYAAPPEGPSGPQGASDGECGARDVPGAPVATDGRTAARVLSVDELVPIAVALEHRRRQLQRGHRLILHPLPKCPVCGVRPDELLESESRLTDLEMAWLPCGHRIVVDSKTVYSVACQAMDLVDVEEQRCDALRAPDAPQASTAAPDTDRCPHDTDTDPGHDWCGPADDAPEHCADCGALRASKAAMLRARLDAAIRPVMLFGLQDTDLSTERIGDWADWIVKTVMETLNDTTGDQK